MYKFKQMLDLLQGNKLLIITTNNYNNKTKGHDVVLIVSYIIAVVQYRYKAI